MMRQIIVLTRYIASLILGGRNVKYELPDKTEFSPADELHCKLKRLVAVNEFCRAEDLLFAELDSSNDEYLAVALDFYDTLNELEDAVLDEYNFPREEILSGVHSVALKFGLKTED